MSCPKSLWGHSRKMNQYPIKAMDVVSSSKQSFSECGPQISPPYAPVKLIKPRFLGPHLKTTEFESQKFPKICILNRLPQPILIHLKLENLKTSPPTAPVRHFLSLHKTARPLCLLVVLLPVLLYPDVGSPLPGAHLAIFVPDHLGGPLCPLLTWLLLSVSFFHICVLY